MQTLPTYNQLIEDAMIKFTKLLSESEPQFITESNVHQLRKKTLEILQRTNPLVNLTQTVNYEQRLVFTRDLLTLIYQLIDKENEENVIICFKIIIDYHRYLKNIALTNEVY
jgi:transformation/transcription domain-associated protein